MIRSTNSNTTWDGTSELRAPHECQSAGYDNEGTDEGKDIHLCDMWDVWQIQKTVNENGDF